MGVGKHIEVYSYKELEVNRKEENKQKPLKTTVVEEEKEKETNPLKIEKKNQF